MQEANLLTQAIVASRAAEAIIRAEKIEKYYAQPSQRRGLNSKDEWAVEARRKG